MDAIRLATEQDAGPISHVHVESWRATYKGIVPDPYLAGLDETDGTDRWREWIGSGTPVFVALQEGVVVGFASGGPMRDPFDGFDAELFTIYLLQHVQRRGIGTALLRKLASRLDHDGFKKMAAWVLEDNASSSFYQRSGALRVASKEIEIGGVFLPVVAYGWPSLRTIMSPE
jgi:L-amino acid N-acyltransferase YncA